MKLAVIGSINMDQVVTTERIPGKGETLAGSDLRYISGGKGANQAVAMARLDAEVSMFGCVGDDDNGRQLLDALKKEGVDVSHVAVREEAPTGLAIITVSENDNIIIVVSGANGLVDDAYIDSIADQLTDCDLVVFQHEIPIDTVHYAVSFCYEKGIPAVLNPAPADKVPEDIGLVGFDDVRISKLVTPAITTIHQPIAEMGRCAIEIICSSIRGETYRKNNVFGVDLIERDTTA